MKIAITRDDGGVSIMDLARGLTLADVPAEVAKLEAAGIKAARWREISESDLPRSRENRDAWRDDGKTIEVDPARIKPPSPDPLADLKAAVAALKKTGVITDEMIEAEKSAPIKAAGVETLRKG